MIDNTVMKTFSKNLLQWYAVNKRDLPWRQTRNPYFIWLSEIILQQTRVAQGLEYYLRFVERFPTLSDLACASQDEVLKLWQGLGYYSRARNLHQAAKQMNGIFPTSYKEVLALKGVGAYTAAAICSISYNMPYAVVDGNVYRVLSRVFAITLPVDSAAGKKKIALLAQDLLDKDSAGDYNQAIMDLGAMICTPQSPSCTQCPLVSCCQAYKQGKQELFPIKKKVAKVSSRYFHYIYVEQGRYTWLFKRKAGDIWAKLYEPLLIETEGDLKEPSALLNVPSYKDLLGTRISNKIVSPVKHILSHRVIYADLYHIKIPPSFPIPENILRADKRTLASYPVSRLVQKLLEKAGYL